MFIYYFHYYYIFSYLVFFSFVRSGQGTFFRCYHTQLTLYFLFLFEFFLFFLFSIRVFWLIAYHWVLPFLPRALSLSLRLLPSLSLNLISFSTHKNQDIRFIRKFSIFFNSTVFIFLGVSKIYVNTMNNVQANDKKSSQQPVEKWYAFGVYNKFYHIISFYPAIHGSLSHNVNRVLRIRMLVVFSAFQFSNFHRHHQTI